MLQITNRAGRMIWLLLYGFLVMGLGIMIFLSVTEPQHNLISWQMAVGTLFGTGALLAAFFLWDRFPRKLRRSSFLYGALLMLFGILLYVISCHGRNVMGSMVDYGQIWESAQELSEGRELSGINYYKRYANNIKPMLYLSALFRIAKFLHISEPFYLVLGCSVLEVLGAVWSAGILAGSAGEERENNRIPVLMMFVCTLPIWANVQTFYTDSMSFMTGVTVLALLRLCFEAGARLKKVGYLLLAGVMLGFGMSVKVTVLIPVIAGFIVFCFTRPSGKHWLMAGAFFLCSLTAYGATTLYAQNFEIWNEAQESAEPVIDWIALGMKGNGSWGDNREYIEYVTGLPSKQEKTAYTLRYIWENRSDFWNPSHLVQKLRFNFASGGLGSGLYAYSALKEHNPVWETFSPWGKYYWRTSQICFCYLFSVYTCYLLGAAVTFCRLLRKKAIPAMKAVADLALMGNMVFLMIWEANNRQLYNQMPVILFGGG